MPIVDTPFLGPFNVSRSTNLADNQLMNLFPELVDTKDGKSVGALYMTPGLDLLTACGSGPIRGLGYLGDSLMVVSGNALYSVSDSMQASKLGTIGSSAGQVSMLLGQNQLAIFDSNNGYLTTGGSPSTINLPFQSPAMGVYQDGFGLALQDNSQTIWQSNSLDLSTWDALNFSAADGSPENIVSMIDFHRELWLFKSTSTEVWYNSGLSGFAFERIDGVYPEVGSAARWSVAKYGDLLFLLGRSIPGSLVVTMFKGYSPVRVSTYAVETAISSYGTTSDAIGYCYEQEGHAFYVLTFPSANATWCLDITETEKAGVPLWHQRGSFSNGAFGRHWGNNYLFWNGLHIVGDYQNGNLYSFDMDNATDNGAQRKWLRSWRALKKPVPSPMRFSSLLVDMETGAQVPAGTSPQCMLRWSDDGGHNWSDYMIASAGQPGQTAQRIKFNRLGSTRRDGGLDRIFELSSADQFKVALLGAAIDLQ